MKIEQTLIEKIKADFEKMQTKEDFISLLNNAKHLIYGEKTIPFELKQITWYANTKINTKRYLQFSIKKKSGKERVIHAPVGGLKSIQKALNLILQSVFEPHRAAYGFVCSIFIFIVERSIILSKKNHWVLVTCRVILGFAIALFGSALLDLVIFKKDIDYKIIDQLSTKSKLQIASVYNEQLVASENLNKEMSGKGGSKKRGFGAISKELKQQKEDAKIKVSKLEKEFSEIEATISNHNNPNHVAILEKLGFKTIAFRAEVLHNLLKDDIFKMSIWGLLMVICFMMEFMPIITKLGSKKTAYELDQEAIELILVNRRIQVLEKSNHYLKIGEVGRMAEDFLSRKSNHPLLN